MEKLEKTSQNLVELISSISNNEQGINCTITKAPDDLGFCNIRISYINKDILNLMSTHRFSINHITSHKLKEELNISIKFV
jgi:NADPH-dependent 7-cyano-7-deazaguanine reductase QueF